jgi:acetyltransferase-like isoleucine patch superfamily enzyme
MQSLTLRDILRTHHGVTVGNYSYGSLMLPGRADSRTEIGNYVSIGPDVRRFGAAHPITQPSMHPFWYNPRLGMVDPTADVTRTSITIGHDVWIGANSLILPGCTRIGNGAIIGAGTVVTKDIGAYEIWVGNPGRKINERLTEPVRKALDESRWWTLDPHEAGRVLAEAGGSVTGLLPRV